MSRAASATAWRRPARRASPEATNERSLPLKTITAPLPWLAQSFQAFAASLSWRAWPWAWPPRASPLPPRRRRSPWPARRGGAVAAVRRAPARAAAAAAAAATLSRARTHFLLVALLLRLKRAQPPLLSHVDVARELALLVRLVDRRAQRRREREVAARHRGRPPEGPAVGVPALVAARHHNEVALFNLHLQHWGEAASRCEAGAAPLPSHLLCLTAARRRRAPRRNGSAETLRRPHSQKGSATWRWGLSHARAAGFFQKQQKCKSAAGGWFSPPCYVIDVVMVVDGW